VIETDSKPWRLNSLRALSMIFFFVSVR